MHMRTTLQTRRLRLVTLCIANNDMSLFLQCPNLSTRANATANLNRITHNHEYQQDIAKFSSTSSSFIP